MAGGFSHHTAMEMAGYLRQSSAAAYQGNGPSSLVGVVDRISLVGATIQQVADFHLPSLRETSLHLSCERL